MNFLDAFRAMDQVRPFSSEAYDMQAQTHEPQYHDTTKMSEQYSLYNIQMPRYTLDGYISPYPSNNWDLSSNILSYVNDDSRFPALEPKLDPNRIFTADIAALRTIASDQTKVIRMFEKRFQEAMADKGKFGLTEDDIEALQALTAARTALMNITKVQVDIRKNIADLKIKQAQQQQKGPGMGGEMGQSGSPYDAKSIMDKIFEMPSAPVSASFNTDVVGTDAASAVLDALVPDIDPNIAAEVQDVKTYVVVGDTDDDYEFQALDKNGMPVEGFEIPSVSIDKINRETRRAIASNLEEYEVKFRNE